VIIPYNIRVITNGINRSVQGTRFLEISLALLPALAAFLIYLPILGNGFAWDDRERILQSQPLRSITPDSLRWMFTTLSGGYWMPLSWLSFALDFRMGGLDPKVFHITNMVFHALDSALVFILSLRLLGLAREGRGTVNVPVAATSNVPAALLAALLFALHPIHVESVAWATERKDVLYAFFFLLGILCHLSYAAATARRGWKYAACLVCYALAMMAKPMAVTMPLVLLVLDGWPLRRLREGVRAVLLEKVPFLLMALPVALITSSASGHTKSASMVGDLSFLFRTLNAFRSLGFYLWKLLVPTDLSPLYPYPSVQGTAYALQNILAVSVVLLINAACFRYRRRIPSLTAAWLCYLATLAPVLGFIQVGGQAAADRFLYLSSLAVILPFSAGLSMILTRRRWWLVVISALLCLASGFATVKQCAVWKDSISVFERIVKLYPADSHFAHSNLAAQYAEAGRLEESLKEYERAATLPPLRAQILALAGKGAVLADLGREAEAERVLREVLVQDPNCAQAHRNLWVLYGRRKMYGAALKEAEAAAAIEPGNPENYNRMASIHVFMGQLDKATESYRKCSELDPFQPLYRVRLGVLYMQKGLFEKAIEELQAADRIRPNDPSILALLSQACGKAGKAGKADLAARYGAKGRAVTGASGR